MTEDRQLQWNYRVLLGQGVSTNAARELASVGSFCHSFIPQSAGRSSLRVFKSGTWLGQEIDGAIVTPRGEDDFTIISEASGSLAARARAPDRPAHQPFVNTIAVLMGSSGEVPWMC